MNDILDSIIEQYDLKVEAYESIDLQDDANDVYQKLSEFEIDDMDF